MPWIKQDLDAGFAEYIRRSPIDQLPQLLASLDAHTRSTSLTMFRSREEADTFIETLKSN